MLTGERLATTGLDAVALKPKEHDLPQARSLDVDSLVVDYEGREHLPDWGTLSSLAEGATVYLTAPVRADGFDPQGDDSLLRAALASLPESVGLTFVAGNPAYLTEGERTRAIAPRLRAALDAYHGDRPAPWVGTEGVERLALAAGGVQFDLLSRSTLRELRALRTVGMDEDVAVYAPTVLSADEDEILDAVGGYVSRRRAVSAALPEGAATDSRATGRARDVLLAAAGDFALVGTASEVRDQVAALHEAGATTVVGYPARGIESLR
ncbi:DUF7388 family protein [Halomarina litorea]|uniref:DUF7388 family protein n=1 Tax=Halomarina litorea TaxID=2961595 RepID=UPI0020C3D0C6|nr:luciferase [Halomarina sp. BCD28]